MFKGGNEEYGYKIQPDLSHRILRIQVWGLWDMKFMEDYAQAIGAACRTMRPPP